jgi:hypothetical protein
MAATADAPPDGAILYITESGIAYINTLPSGTPIAIKIRSAALLGMKTSVVKHAVVNVAAIIADINILLAIAFFNQLAQYTSYTSSSSNFMYCVKLKLH